MISVLIFQFFSSLSTSECIIVSCLKHGYSVYWIIPLVSNVVLRIMC